jgi:hypothetical protein
MATHIIEGANQGRNSKTTTSDHQARANLNQKEASKQSLAQQQDLLLLLAKIAPAAKGIKQKLHHSMQRKSIKSLRHKPRRQSLPMFV